MINLNSPHQRRNPLTGEWVLISPHRSTRPWQGQVEKAPFDELPTYDPACYLCPGNKRAGERQNPVYSGVFVFDNDFPALLPPPAMDESLGNESTDREQSPVLFQRRTESGICRVICFSPRHDLTLPELTQKEVEDVVRSWSQETLYLGALDHINYVQVFENKGALMGCSTPHPHSQIWASSVVPNEPAKELSSQEAYLRDNGSCLLCDYLTAEVMDGTRTVAQNEQFVAVVPFWAVWPFEVLLVSKRHAASLVDLNQYEITGLADILHQITVRYDNLFEISFPYSMGFHQAPTDSQPHPSWHLHAHFYPPLLRSATVRKFMVGYEILAMPQRDLTPELAADRLRSLDSGHYRHRLTNI